MDISLLDWKNLNFDRTQRSVVTRTEELYGYMISLSDSTDMADFSLYGD